MSTPLPRSFTALAASNLAAQSAEQLSLAAVPLVAVLALGAGPGETGVLAAVQTLPFLLLSIPLGLLADRMSRRRLMLWAEALRALSLLALLAMVLSNHLSIAGLAILGFIGAVGTVGFSVAAPALIPALVPREQLGQANGRIELARSAAYAAGPALAGALVAWAGASSAFVLAAMLSASAVALAVALDGAAAPGPADPPSTAGDPRRRALRLAAALPAPDAADRRGLEHFLVRAAGGLCAVRRARAGAERAIGRHDAGMYGAGMVVGALASSRVIGALPFGRAIQLGPAVSVLAAFTMVATLFLPTGVLAAASFFLFGAGPIMWTITSTTLRQSITPGAMLGRVSSVFLAVNAGARPVGAALGALVGASWGEAACLWLAAAGLRAAGCGDPCVEPERVAAAARACALKPRA